MKRTREEIDQPNDWPNPYYLSLQLAFPWKVWRAEDLHKLKGESYELFPASAIRVSYADGDRGASNDTHISEKSLKSILNERKYQDRHCSVLSLRKTTTHKIISEKHATCADRTTFYGIKAQGGINERR